MDISRYYNNRNDEWVYLVEDSRLEKIVFRHYNMIDISRYDYPSMINRALNYLKLHKPKTIGLVFNILTIEKICEYIGEAENLEEIRFIYGDSLDDKLITEKLMDAFCVNKTINHVQFYINIFDDSLMLIGNRINDTGIKSILIGNLDEYRNSLSYPISYRRTNSFVNLSLKSKYLEKLTISGISDDDGKTIGTGFPSLKNLYVRSSKTFGDIGLGYLSLKKLEILDIRNCNVTDHGLIEYGKTLSKNIYLRDFSLTGHQLSKDVKNIFIEKYASRCVMLEYIWLGSYIKMRLKKITWNIYYIKVLGKNNPTVIGWKLACKRIIPCLPDELVDYILSFLTVRN